MSGRLNPNMLETRNANLVKGLPPGPRLRELETIIRRGQKAFVEVGNALLEIRESRIYRERGFNRFDDYCREHWQFSKPRATQLIRSAEAVAEVNTFTPEGSVPTNARQAHALAQAPEGERAEVWAEVVDEHEPAEITAAVIREHVEARRPSPPPAPPEVVIDLTAITNAVRAAVRAGATTNELYAAYQAGFH